MDLMKIETDKNQREVTLHGSAQFPLEINHDHLYHFYRRYICCHWHEDLEITVVLRGCVQYQLKDSIFELHQGEGLVINSCVPHSAVSLTREEPVLLTTIFHPSFLYGTPTSRIYQSLLHPYQNAGCLSGIRLRPDQAAVMKQIDVLFQEAAFGYELQIKSLLCQLFFELLSPYENILSAVKPSGREALQRLEALIEKIHATYTDPLSLDSLASHVSLSREGCCRFFKKMTGKTISEYLKDYRISQSILLLQNDRYSIEQIAQLVGFGNSGRFAAAFAQRMNCTPRQYRNSFQNKSCVSIVNTNAGKKLNDA